MRRYHSPEEIAEFLAIDPAEVLSWMDRGELRAVRLGDVFRVAEDDLERFLETRILQPMPGKQTAQSNGGNHMDRVRLEKTFAGRSEFRISGTAKTGARIWPGKMQSGLFFSREFFEKMFSKFQGKELAAGLIFSGPEPGSLGEWIQENLPTKMNPTYCVAGLLAAEGYAERKGAGVIRFFPDALQRLCQ